MVSKSKKIKGQLKKLCYEFNYYIPFILLKISFATSSGLISLLSISY